MATLGLRGMELSCSWDNFHTFPSLPPGTLDQQEGLTRRAAFPNIRIAFGESGIGWLPYALDRMDFG